MYKSFCAFNSVIHFALLLQGNNLLFHLYLFNLNSWLIFKVVMYFWIRIFSISIDSSYLYIFSSLFLHLLQIIERANVFEDVWGHSKSTFVEERGEGVIEKRTKKNRGRGVLAFVFVRFFEKTLRFSKWSFIVILQFFLLMAVLNIKQTIMKDYNIQSCHWMKSGLTVLYHKG